MLLNLLEPGITWENSCYSLYHVPASMPQDVGVAEPFSKFLSAFTFSDEEICYPCVRVWVPGIILIQLLAVVVCRCVLCLPKPIAIPFDRCLALLLPR